LYCKKVDEYFDREAKCSKFKHPSSLHHPLILNSPDYSNCNPRWKEEGHGLRRGGYCKMGECYPKADFDNVAVEVRA
jgi:hypothetical protein